MQQFDDDTTSASMELQTVPFSSSAAAADVAKDAAAYSVDSFFEASLKVICLFFSRGTVQSLKRVVVAVVEY